MSKYISIVEPDRTRVHLVGFGGWTLCGLEADGDEEAGIEKGRPSRGPIDCEQCTKTILKCKEVPSRMLLSGIG